MTNLIVSLDQTVRTITLVPAEPMLIQFNAAHRNPGVYEVQRIEVQVIDGNVSDDLFNGVVITGRKVAKSDPSKYTSGEWVVYNDAVRDQAKAQVSEYLGRKVSA